MTGAPGGAGEALARIAQALGNGAELVVVGGWVRDRLLGREAGDMDLATALMPDEVMRRAAAAGLKALPTGLQHGTVTVLAADRAVEITTFRGDGIYLDGRHPQTVKLGVSLREDLARRDFTINALALPLDALEAPDWEREVVDPFGGREDLGKRLIRAVGDPRKRFAEDGLRPLRACRFASQLGFHLDPETFAAIPERLEVSAKVSVERVLAELTKLLTGADPEGGLQLLADSGLLDLWLPELRPMMGCGQNRHHRFPVWEHTLEAVALAPPEAGLRWAALLHDAGKPSTRSADEEGEVHFYGHEAVSLDLARLLLQRLKASHALTGEVIALVRHHGVHPTGEWSDGACRRLLRKLAEDRLPLEQWGRFRIADQVAKGFGEEPCRTEHGKVMDRLRVLAAAKPPLDAKALALDGRALMRLAGRKGGPWVGELQKFLLDAVIEDPARNTEEELHRLASEWLEKTRR